MKGKKDALKVIQTYADREPAHTGGAERAKQLTAQLYGEGAAHAARGGALAVAAVVCGAMLRLRRSRRDGR